MSYYSASSSSSFWSSSGRRAFRSMFFNTNTNTSNMHSRSSFTTSTKTMKMDRCCRLLDAARGYHDRDDNDHNNYNYNHKKKIKNMKKRPLPAFPLQAKHFAGYHDHVRMTNSKDLQYNKSITTSMTVMTPSEFHQTLCHRIRTAQRRVLIASLYIGPAAVTNTAPSDASTTSSNAHDMNTDSSNSHHHLHHHLQTQQRQELELLNALRDIATSNNSSNHNDNTNDKSRHQNESTSPPMEIRVVLDENRALRPVPTFSTSVSSKSSSSLSSKSSSSIVTTTKTMTSSAQAVAEALYHQEDQQQQQRRRKQQQLQQNGNLDDHNNDNNPANNKNGVYLFQVLSPSILAQIIPNPLNEVAGVFHIKVYVIDDELIISGANLSQEYFDDRHDRYLHLVHGANGLVDFYAQLIHILCDHSSSIGTMMIPSSTTSTPLEFQNIPNPLAKDMNSSSSFLEAITNHFQCDQKQEQPTIPTSEDLFKGTSTTADDDDDRTDEDGNRIVAVAVPTFQAPEGYFGLHRDDTSLEFITDVEATLNLLDEASSSSGLTTTTTTVQLSSAYLNPTTELVRSLSQFDTVELLTAGRLSHGFKPKKKAGNKGKDWIPTVFDYMASQSWELLLSQQTKNQRKSDSTAVSNGSSSSSSSSRTGDKSENNTNKEDPSTRRTLYHWEREDWSFHAKGMWIRHGRNNDDDDNNNDGSGDDGTSNLSAAIVGSSNFGERSFRRDMESNIILIFPPPSSSKPNGDNDHSQNALQSYLDQEWDDMKGRCRMVPDPNQLVQDAPPLPWYVRVLLPFIKSFF